MTIPEQFTREAVAAASEKVEAPYRDFVTSGEPYRSLFRENPRMRTPKREDALAWGEGWYYDTTVARKHPEWKDKDLPEPSKDIQRLRRDFREWGYCLIEDATSPEQTRVLHERVAEQAAAERALAAEAGP